MLIKIQETRCGNPDNASLKDHMECLKKHKPIAYPKTHEFYSLIYSNKEGANEKR